MTTISIEEAYEDIQDRLTLAMNDTDDLARIYGRIMGGAWEVEEINGEECLVKQQ